MRAWAVSHTLVRVHDRCLSDSRRCMWNIQQNIHTNRTANVISFMIGILWLSKFFSFPSIPLPTYGLSVDILSAVSSVANDPFEISSCYFG